MRVQAQLSGLGGCQKPNCRHLAPLNRHHKAHEALWLGAWAHRKYDPRSFERRKWHVFVKRYNEFRDEDCCLICLPHHAEIHAIYDRIIADDRAKTGLPLYVYSWKQARVLMARLVAACEAWLQEETPGIDSAYYEKIKNRRRAQLARHAAQRHDPPPGAEELAKHRSRKVRSKRKKN